MSTFVDGTNHVGSDVVPGTYRSFRADGEGAEDFCYWERVSGFGGSEAETIANSAGVGPRVVTIEPADAGFVSTGCGTWTSDLSPLAGPITDGVWIVGVDIQPGDYRSEGGDLCLWQRLAGFGGTDDESLEIGMTPTANIRPTDAGFMSMHCGRWQAAE